MKYLELDKHLSSACEGKESFHSVYVVSGVDAYLRQSAVASFKSVLMPEYADFNLSVISVGSGMGAVLDSLTLYPVFDDKKVVIVPDVSDKLGEQDKGLLSKYLLDPNPTAILVLVEDGKNLADLVKEHKLQTVDCSKLDENSIGVIVDKILSEPPRKSIDSKALHALVEKTLGDMSRIVCEVTKLKSYSGDIITLADVEIMVSPDLEFALYELTSAVSEKQAEKALEILDVFFKQGVKGYTLINMLYNQYRKMLHAELHKTDDAEVLAPMLEISSKQLYHVRRVSKNYTQMRLKQAVDYLHNLQYAIVSGKRLEHTAVHDAVLTLLNI
jgi:DNA polymerase III delta subunit